MVKGGLDSLAVSTYRKQIRDYYKILGISRRNATTEQIREAFLLKARRFHPDRNKSPEAEKIFKLIERAKSILSNPVERKKYDIIYGRIINRKKNSILNNKYNLKTGPFDKNKPEKKVEKNENTVNDLVIQNQAKMYNLLLKEAKKAVFNRKWEKAEEHLNLALKFAKMFEFDHTKAIREIRNFHFQSKKVNFCGLFPIYRSDNDVLKNIKEINPSANSTPLFKIQNGNVINLILTDRNLRRIPNSINNMVKLEELFIINGDRIEELPESIGSLSWLNKLYLNTNELKSLPKNIGKLTSLRWLSVKSSNLRRIPSSIGNLTNLEHLIIDCNHLIELPKNIGSLTNLIGMHITGKNLQNIPETIGKLWNMKILNIESTNIAEMPEIFKTLGNLKILNLINNRLKNLPDSISDCNNLEILNLKDNKLSNLPDSIGKLVHLKKLNLLGNNFENFPDSLGDLDFLEEIYIDCKNLKILPDCLLKMKNLKIICYSPTVEKPRIPKRIKKLNQSAEIEFISCYIDEMPSQFIIKQSIEREVSCGIKANESEFLFKFMENRSKIQLREQENFKLSLIEALPESHISNFLPNKSIEFQSFSL